MLARGLFGLIITQTVLHVFILLFCFIASKLTATDLLSVVYPEVIIPCAVGGVLGITVSLLEEKFYDKN
jgi:hypothetical protein